MIHAFTYGGGRYVLDVETGSIHMPDEESYKVLEELERTEAQGGDINAALRGGGEIADELLELKRAGLLFSAPDKDTPMPENVIKAMCLHLAHDCDLRCAYCFAKGGAFAGKRELMSAETAKAAIDFVINISGARRNIEIDFFGGEPLLNFSVLKKTVSYARSKEKQSGKHFRFTVTTNAYGITDEMIKYLNRQMDNVVVSIDGRQHVHDAVRKTAGGAGSYERVAENAYKLLAGRQGEYYVRGTFTANNLDFSRDVLHLADLGYSGVSIEPVVTAGANAIKEEHLPAVFAEYETLAAEYARRRKEGAGFTFFHFMVDLNAGPCKLKRIRGCGAGTEYVAVSPAGDIYPCHQFVSRPEYKIGSVFKKGLDGAITRRFEQCNINNISECQRCWAKYYCSGGCAAANFNINNDIFVPYKIGCAMQKKRLEIALAVAAAEQAEEI
ncbi:MAG: thioether cross-link-forming SCIFF peptide maturase [Christensenellales bacterium]